MFDVRLRRCLHVILNWCSSETTVPLVRSLLERGVPADSVVVIDNASPDGSGAAIADALPGIQVVGTGQNLGFAGGMNRGIRQACEEGFDRVALLNDDLELLRGCLSAMHDAMDSAPDAGVVGAVLEGRDGEVIHSGKTLHPVTGAFANLPVPAPEAPALACDWVSGALLLLRIEAVESGGLLDEDFFMYWEEVDLCLRWGQVGWRTYLAPGARARHEDAGLGTHAAMPLYLGWRNRWLIGRRHWALPLRLLFHLAGLCYALRDVLGRVRAGDLAQLWIPVLGTLHGALGWRGRRYLDRIS